MIYEPSFDVQVPHRVASPDRDVAVNALRTLLLLGLAALTACRDPAPAAALGTVERERIDLVAEHGERITDIHVMLGERVEAGQPLVRQDATRIGARLAQARAQVSLARAQLDEARAGPRRQTISQARARLASARSALETARLELERDRELVRSSYTTRAQVDIVAGRYEEAGARVREAEAALEELQAGTRPEVIAQASSRLAAAEAAEAEIRLELEHTRILAPRAGRVEALPFSVGERPAPGQVVVSLLTSDRPYVRVYLPAAQRARLEAGSPATVRVAGVASPVSARLRWISEKAAFTPFFALTEHDRGRLTYLAEFDLEGDLAGDLQAGQPVELSLE